MNKLGKNAIPSIMLKELFNYSKKYGYYSVASLQIKYHILFEKLKCKANSFPEDYNASLELKRSKEIVEEHYENTTRSNNNDRHENYREVYYKDGYMEYVYNLKRYNDIYSLTGEKAQKYIFPVNNIVGSIIPGKYYIYIINDEEVPIIYSIPVPTREIICGRNSFNVCHPMLAHQYNLTVLGAGEIQFSKNKNGNISGAIINNSSGHYRPSVKSLDIVRKSLSATLNIDIRNIIEIRTEK